MHRKKAIQIHTSLNINYELINKNAEIVMRMISLYCITHTHTQQSARRPDKSKMWKQKYARTYQWQHD